MGTFKDNRCNINCVRNKYACYHRNGLKCTEEYQAATNTIEMLETSFVSRVEDKHLLQISPEVPEDTTWKKHMVLEKGTNKYSTTRQNLCRKRAMKDQLSSSKRNRRLKIFCRTFSSAKAEMA